MRYGDNFNPGQRFTIDDQEGEPAENIASPRAEDAAPTRGQLQNYVDRVVELSNELISGAKAPTPIPLDCRPQFDSGFRVETDALTAHPLCGLVGIAIRSRE